MIRCVNSVKKSQSMVGDRIGCVAGVGMRNKTTKPMNDMKG